MPSSRSPNNAETTERYTVRIPKSKAEKIEEIIEDDETEETTISTVIRNGVNERIADYEASQNQEQNQNL